MENILTPLSSKKRERKKKQIIISEIKMIDISYLSDNFPLISTSWNDVGCP